MRSDELSSASSSSDEVAQTSSERDSSSEDHDQPTKLVESHFTQKKPNPTEAQAEYDADSDSDPDSGDDEWNAQRIVKSKSQSPSSAKLMKNRPNDEVHETSSEADSSSEDHDQPTKLVESPSTQKKPAPTENHEESDTDSDNHERNAQPIVMSKSQSPSSPAKSVKKRPSDEVYETSSEADSSSEDQDQPLKLVESHSTQKKPSPTEAQIESNAESKSHDDERNAESIVKSKSHSPSPAKSAHKRPNEGNLRDTASKKAKRSEIPAASKDQSKNPVQRVWSDDDGIAILTGLAVYAEKTGDAMIKNMDGFHNFIRKSIQAKASNKQLAEKIRNLKKKYVQNCEREKTRKGLRLLSAYSKTIFELSKKIWANEEANRITDIATKNVKVNLKEASDPNESVNEIIRFVRSLGLSVLDDDAIKRRYELIGASEKEELLDTWKELQNAECDLFAKLMKFVKNFSSLILEGTKSSGN